MNLAPKHEYVTKGEEPTCEDHQPERGGKREPGEDKSHATKGPKGGVLKAAEAGTRVVGRSLSHGASGGRRVKEGEER